MVAAVRPRCETALKSRRPFEDDAEALAFQGAHRPLGDAFGVAGIEVGRALFRIGGFPCDHMVDRHEERVGDGDHRLVVAVWRTRRR